MYEDTYTEYNPREFEYGQYRQKFMTGNPPYAEWDYGDTLHLYFNIKHIMDDPNTLFDFTHPEDISISFKVFNYRYEQIYEACGRMDQIVDENGNICVDIDAELSNQLTPGTYNCSLQMQQENIKLTIVRASECLIHVR